MPTYPQVGLLAPALLALMRFCQGAGIGRWSGWRRTAGGGDRQTGPAGMGGDVAATGRAVRFLLANGAFPGAGLVHWPLQRHAGPGGAFLTWGWRDSLLLSAVMVAIGLYDAAETHRTVFARPSNGANGSKPGRTGLRAIGGS